ncbi:lipopolysaccharide biosynthesis protein [Terrabacter sp. 2TAF16]|uniref:lipopolysaccharide biosynthesis protein n=1 Tax=Terrabacter sp. 2TAF16 TaxID=3233008 RepID=UPI003F9B95B0
MTRQRTPRHGGVTEVTLGNLAIALSVVAMLAVGPRTLGPEAFAGFALAWTATTLFGYGLAMPTEQLVARRVSAGLAAHTRVPIIRLAVLGVVATVAALVWTGWSATAGTYTHTGFAVASGIFGWTVASAVRGHVAGSGHLGTYATLFGVEALLRLALVAAAVATPSAASWLMACAVGIPILLAGAIGVMANRRRPTATLSQTPNMDVRGEQLSFVLVALCYQLCLNGAPLVLDWRVGGSAPATVGAFVVASSYFRLASVITGGFTTPALVSLSRSWASGQLDEFSRDLRQAVRAVTVLATVASGLAMACAPLALPLFYGRNPDVSLGIAAALAMSTVAATASAVAGTGLIAAGRAPWAALCWALGAICMVALVSFDDGIGVATAVGLLAGPGLVLIALLSVLSLAIRTREQTPQTS